MYTKKRQTEFFLMFSALLFVNLNLTTAAGVRQHKTQWSEQTLEKIIRESTLIRISLLCIECTQNPFHFTYYYMDKLCIKIFQLVLSTTDRLVINVKIIEERLRDTYVFLSVRECTRIYIIEFFIALFFGKMIVFFSIEEFKKWS